VRGKRSLSLPRAHPLPEPANPERRPNDSQDCMPPRINKNQVKRGQDQSQNTHRDVVYWSRLE
jgi:hypothetical protein